jgi:hypothetical protein
MGTLYYGSSRSAIPVSDRELAHLRVVMISKLRRNESFAFSWVKPPAEPVDRSTIWISGDTLLEFEFAEKGTPELNRVWLEQLSQSASSAAGLSLVPEPDTDR